MSQPPQYPSLHDRAVLISGGASGIGASLVEHFARQGCRVAFLDVDQVSATALVEELTPEVELAPFFLACDVRAADALEQALTEVQERLGPVTVLVNNAASDDRRNLDEVTAEYWDERMAVNLRHQFLAVKFLREGMAQAGGGSVINMGSIAWRLGLPELTHYGTAKAAIVGLTKGLARELGPEHIRVNCIEPGLVMTERQERLWLTPKFKSDVLRQQSLPDLCMPSDVARLALFLASDESAMISGQSLVIDGGWV